MTFGVTIEPFRLFGWRLLGRGYLFMETASQRINAELGKATDISIVELVDDLIAHAHDIKASDVHIDPHEEEIKVRMRIDGVLHTAYTLPRSIYSEVLCRIKILSNLRIDEHQAAQDGRFRVTLKDDTIIDIRVSIVPTYYGENVVLRLLIDNQDRHTLQGLGYREVEREKVAKALKRPHGMILVTGPTGSGKTTTLYTFIKQLNSDDVSIITIEDPVEYAIGGITQIQTNPKHGLTFASGLRSILRQDPDLVMVGEIRDGETASIAVNTALTGHLLFSTLHTNDAVTTLPRLHDMGIESYLIASTVNMIIGQRLLRKNCEKCAKTKKITDAERDSLSEIIPKKLLDRLKEQKVGAGCDACSETGFSGRLAINEILLVDDPIREAILRRESTASMRKLAVENGMTPMLEDGILKVIAGHTTIEEVLRVINE